MVKCSAPSKDHPSSHYKTNFMGVGRGLEVGGGGGAIARSQGLEAVNCTYVTMG